MDGQIFNFPIIQPSPLPLHDQIKQIDDGLTHIKYMSFKFSVSLEIKSSARIIYNRISHNYHLAGRVHFIEEEKLQANK